MAQKVSSNKDKNDNEDVDDLGPMMGKVFLYFSNNTQLAGVKPSGTVNCTVSPTVGPVLKTVGRKFSLIRGK